MSADAQPNFRPVIIGTADAVEVLDVHLKGWTDWLGVIRVAIRATECQADQDADQEGDQEVADHVTDPEVDPRIEGGTENPTTPTPYDPEISGPTWRSTASMPTSAPDYC